MQIRHRLKLPHPQTAYEKALEAELQSYTQLLAQLLNKGLKFGDNFNLKSHDVSDTGVADTEFTITHELGRTPTGYLVISNTTSGVVYNGSTANDATTLYLRCSAANAAITVLAF